MTTPIAGEGAVDAYARLAELGLTLPSVVPPLAAYAWHVPGARQWPAGTPHPQKVAVTPSENTRPRS